MDCYKAVRDNPEDVLKALRKLKNSADDYYAVRASKPRESHTLAARFIYLCSLSFNGIYRENRNGSFNVPYGSKTQYRLATADQIRAASKILGSAQIQSGDFERTTAHAEPGDFVYLDPPYTLGHQNNGFIKYNARLFSWEDQQRLAVEALRLAKLGVHVIVTNADHSSITKLYKGFDKQKVRRQSVIAATPKHRREVSEAILISPGLGSIRTRGTSQLRDAEAIHRI